MTAHSEIPSSYRDCPHLIRSVHIGGLDRPELLTELRRNGIELNTAGLELFANDTFVTSRVASILDTVEVRVANLGFPDGASFSAISTRAGQLGMFLCPLELAAYLRLQYRDQPEGFIGCPASQHRAPPGSLTITSPPISADDRIPQGFYLRRINNVLWLRGYKSGPEHMWSPEDNFVFALSPGGA